MGRGGKRERVGIEDRQRQVAELYLQGTWQKDIARQVGVDPATITRDIKAIRAEWKTARVEMFDAKLEEQLARIDNLERRYWEAWEKSVKDRTRKFSESSRSERSMRIRAGSRTEENCGNPAYLAGVQWCIEQRCKIMGCYAPVKVAPTDPEGQRPYDWMTQEERVARLQFLFEAVRRRAKQPAPPESAPAPGVAGIVRGADRTRRSRRPTAATTKPAMQGPRRARLRGK